VPQALLGDSVRLRQVLINLVSNAVKFTAQGEVVVDARLESKEGTDVKVRFSVRDTGIGIPAETQQRLFRPFEQADASTTRQYGGTGLGLAISKKIVELMEGEIWMESVPGEGSIFHFTAKLGMVRNLEQHAAAPALELRGMEVLIIDDNATNRRILQEMTGRWHMVPHCADSGPEGLAKLETASAEGRPFRLVLLDEQMPGMGGLEVIERIRGSSLLRAAAIMMLTSADQASSASRCRELGVNSYLIKPIKPAELFAMIQKSLTPMRAPAIAKGPARTTAVRSLSILVAEDNIVNQRVATALLGKMGHQPTLAVDGTEALTKWRQERFDLILMDVQMPGIDGYEATRRIRSQESSGVARTPIIAMTARAMSGDRELCIEAGMDGYVSKPVTREALERALARYTG
jgi:CheY-like chemotaxis protein